MNYYPTTKIFQFTPLREGRPVLCAVTSEILCDFNSRPSARGDHERSAGCVPSRHISIHAPPRGATAAGTGKGNTKLHISIHAPPRGATRAGSCHPSAGENFNSRPSARGDAKNLRKILKKCYFNSRPSARGDLWLEGRVAAGAFQFTPLREGRRVTPSVYPFHRHFNSRPSARGDPSQPTPPSSAVFQFTPLREGRRDHR